MICIKCKYVSIKPYPSHASVGLGRCEKADDAKFYSLIKEHDCNYFEKTEDSKIQKRIDWYDKRR
jgi:hypothetical protein